MAVNTSEEYLDELLEAIEPVINPDGSPEPEMKENGETAKQADSAVMETEPEKTDTEETEQLKQPEPETVSESLPEENETDEHLQPVTDTEEEEADDGMSPEQSVMGAAFNFDGEESEKENDGEDEIAETEEPPEEIAMSEEEIDALLNSAKTQAEDEDPEEDDQQEIPDDVGQLLKQFSEDEDLSDIQTLLEKDERGEAVDESVLETREEEADEVMEEEA